MQQIFVYGKETIPTACSFPPAGHSESKGISIRRGRSAGSGRDVGRGYRAETPQTGAVDSSAAGLFHGFRDSESGKTVCQRRVALLSGKAVPAPGFGRQNQQRPLQGALLRSGMHLSGQGPGVDEILVPRTRQTQVCRVCGANHFPICTVRSCANLTLCPGDGKPLGQLHPKGKIILNTELIKAPRPCIEYVITHEMCHLLHPDHTAAFFTLLETEMPDWRRWKDKLERFMM